jgi:hypothetical protein
VDTVALRDTVVALPAPGDWHPEVREMYLRYTESTAARVLREEDVHEVQLFFSLCNVRLRYLNALTGDPDGDFRTLSSLRIIDQLIDRKANNLGVGPLARTRLGIARLDQALRATEAVKAAQAKEGEEF